MSHQHAADIDRTLKTVDSKAILPEEIEDELGLAAIAGPLPRNAGYPVPVAMPSCQEQGFTSPMSITAAHVVALYGIGWIVFAVDFLVIRWRLPIPFRKDGETGQTLRFRWHTKYLILVLLIFVFAIIHLNRSIADNQQFSHLAESFLRGELHFMRMPGTWYDTVEFNGQHYWPLGPFPAVLLMPFVFVAGLFDQLFLQAYLQPAIVFAVFGLAYLLARHFQYSRYDAVFWGFAFTCATPFLGVSLYSWSGYFAHTVTTMLILAALLEYVGKRRYWLIGLLLGAVLATRVTAALIVIFFFFDLVLLSEMDWRDRIGRATQLVLPIGVTLVLMALYNYGRFGRFSEVGYSYQAVNAFLAASRAHGLLSLAHVPGNVFRFLFAGPHPIFLSDNSQVLRFPYMQGDILGMSVILTSPVFLYLFGLRFPDRRTWLMLATALIVAVPIFAYYGVGYMQLGFRYGLDFMPLLLFVLIQHYGEQRGSLSGIFRVVVVLSASLNLFWWMTMFRAPQMGI